MNFLECKQNIQSVGKNGGDVDNVDNVEKAFKNPQKITFPPTKSLFYQHFRHFSISAFRRKKST